MKITVLSFTNNGAKLCSTVVNLLEVDNVCNGYAHAKYAQTHHLQPFQTIDFPFMAELFKTNDAIVFVGAAGIAVRKIAPHLQNKATDPAVIVIDEKGQFVIPILSGHIGGANELALRLAKGLNATAVITTATDVNDVLAIDVWAVQNGFAVANLENIKYISSAILDAKPVGVVCEPTISVNLPMELALNKINKCGVYIGYDGSNNPFEHTLHLVPKVFVVGMGCRKDATFENVEQLFLQTLQANNVTPQAVTTLATIDIKKDEQAMLQLASKYKMEFITYTSAQLQNAKGDFAPSEFVKATTGVDNVCERAASVASNSGKIVCTKTIGNGATIAVYRGEYCGKYDKK